MLNIKKQFQRHFNKINNRKTKFFLKQRFQKNKIDKTTKFFEKFVQHI